jgi:hypothetical protein
MGVSLLTHDKQQKFEGVPYCIFRPYNNSKNEKNLRRRAESNDNNPYVHFK